MNTVAGLQRGVHPLGWDPTTSNMIAEVEMSSLNSSAFEAAAREHRSCAQVT